MADTGYNPGAAEDPETNPEYADREAAEVEKPEGEGESTTAHVG